MQITLAESAARNARPSPWVGASLIAHMAAVSLLLLRGTTTEARPVPQPEELVYVETRQDPAPSPVPQAPEPEIILGGGESIVPLPVFDVPDIPVVVATTTVDFAGAPQDFDVGILAGRRHASTLASARPGRPVLGAIFDVSTVDQAVRPLNGNPTPRYPSALSSAGVEGEVSVRFVVDTTGRVESGSVTTVRATHALFEREVHEVLRRMRFLAAEHGGVRVRQLVEQTFRFEVERRHE